MYIIAVYGDYQPPPLPQPLGPASAGLPSMYQQQPQTSSGLQLPSADADGRAKCMPARRRQQPTSTVAAEPPAGGAAAQACAQAWAQATWLNKGQMIRTVV